ncbi:uncharacterized protein CFAP97D2 [Pseudopipra pipra]|uniref:uncharacterized protein CFAP97D2 n=1 Tax=Pseudopipra pipra TaxID=415032 RepID=UPI0031395297
MTTQTNSLPAQFMSKDNLIPRNTITQMVIGGFGNRSNFSDMIQTAKSIVDTSAPAIYGHLHQNLGKLKLEEYRLSAIERDNCLLLEMSCIMRKKGQIDNKNDYKAKR